MSSGLAPGGVGAEPPWLRLPADARAIFARRAERLATLAVGHAAGDWLSALSALCAAQARAVVDAPASAPSSSSSSSRPLACDARLPVEAWRGGLDAIVRAMQALALPEPARAALVALADADAGALERRARELLTPAARPADADATTPFVAAALQVWFTAQAARLSAGALVRGEHHDCPVCGFAPVAGVVDGNEHARYLCCGLCASEWRRTRVACARCGATAGISYYELDGAGDGTKAEACAACNAYVKLFYREKTPFAEPLADDAATISLDLLLGEAGLGRGGVNPLVA